MKDLVHMKKIALFATALFFIFVLAGCQRPAEITFLLPDDVVYDTRTVEEDRTLASYPTPTLEDTYFLGWFTDEDFTERFRMDMVFDEDTTLYGKTLPYDGETLLTPLTDELALDPSAYEGKSFRTDGIGEASLAQCIDGDTTFFRGLGESVRYLYVDTPESTSTIEPWGMAASSYVCDVLTDADTIVLEREPHPEEGHPEVHPSVGERGTFGRYLGYVWYDNRLLNLELVELGYSRASGIGNSQYAEYFRLAEHNSRMTGAKIFGEDDPDFDADPVEASIHDLLHDTEEYIHRFVNVEGVVVRTQSDGFYLCADGEEIFFFGGSGWRPTWFRSGFEIRVEKAYLTYWPPGSTVIQLTNFDRGRVDVITEDPDADCLD